MSSLDHESHVGISQAGFDMSRFQRVEPLPSPTEDLVRQLSGYVVGQEDAAKATAVEIIRAETGMNDPTKPKATLLFAGPTGVGKTEMSEAIAKVLYGNTWEKHYLKIDCAALPNQGDVTKLVGTGPQWVGHGNPTLIAPEFLSQKGGSIVVFDEIERAHFEVWEALLSITDKAVLPAFLPTDKEQAANRNNKQIAPTNLKFDNTIVIFTSNAGSEGMQKARKGITGMGFHIPHKSHEQDIRDIALEDLKQVFASIPAFLGRIGKRMVVFRDLDRKDYEQIFDIMLSEINSRIPGHIFVSEPMKDWVIQQGLGSGEYGGRDLKDAINTYIVSKVADQRKAGALRFDTEVLLDRHGDQTVYLQGPEVPTPEPSSPPQHEEPSTPETPKISVEFSYDTPFQISLPPSLPPVDYDSTDETACIVELLHDGKKKGELKISEVLLRRHATNVVFASDTRLYRMRFVMDKTLKSQPYGIEAIINDQTYSGSQWYSDITKGRGNMHVTTWEKGKDNDEQYDLIFPLADTKNITLVIHQPEKKK